MIDKQTNETHDASFIQQTIPYSEGDDTTTRSEGAFKTYYNNY
jgi:hypothetical protein